MNSLSCANQMCLFRGIEALCLELNKIQTSGSAIISTFRHQCDSGRFKKTEQSENYFKVLDEPQTESKIQEVSVERDFSRLTPSFPGFIFSNRSTLMENINQDILTPEKISSPKNLSLSPQTVQVLENVETLVKNAQKQLTQINDNISLYKKNPEIPETQPTIDEDLLRLRQIVAFKFQEANNPSKIRHKYDYKIFTDSVQQVPEEKINKVPRLLKLMTTLPEKCNFKEDEYCKKGSYCFRPKIMSPDSHSSYTCDKFNSKQEKAAQTDEKENNPEMSTFQIQTGPKVIIERSLRVQNLDQFHVSPETSFKQPANIGIYNFQHETLSGQNYLNENQFIYDHRERRIREEHLQAKEILREENSVNKEIRDENPERKVIFRKSVILKRPDESKKSLKTNFEKLSGQISETNDLSPRSHQSTNNDELSSQNSVVNLKSPKHCNIESAKTKAYFEYLSNLERNLDCYVINPNAKNSEEVTKEKRPSCEGEEFCSKPTIISNEKVNVEYKEILRGAQFNPLNPLLCDNKDNKLINDKFSKETNKEIDHINLKKPCVFDLDSALTRNNEIIENVIQNTDMILKTISSNFKTPNNVINEDNEVKTNKNLGIISLQNLKSAEKKLESIKSTLEDNFPEKYSAEKEHEFKFLDEKRLNLVIKSAIKLPKFMTEVNNKAIEQENVSLSSITVNSMSSKENLISEKLSSSTELVAVSKDATLNDLKDLSIEIFSETLDAFQKDSSNVPETKGENKDSRIHLKSISGDSEEDENNRIKMEEKFNQVFSIQSGDCRTKREFSKSESNTSKASSSKCFLNSNSSLKNVNYSANSLQSRENNYSEMEIRIFQSLKHSPAVVKRFITCLFGEIEPRIENEIISILREAGVNATVINQFLIILQNREENEHLITFIKDLGSYLNLSDDKNIDSSNLKKQLEDFLKKRKTNSPDSETDKELSDQVSSEIENRDNKSLQIKLDFDVTAKDKNVIYDDSKLAVAREKFDLIKSQEKVNKHFVDNLDGDFSLKKLIEESFVDRSKNDEMPEFKKETSKEIKLQTGELNFKEVKSNSCSEIKSFNSISSLIESSKRPDYSKNFIDNSSASKYCKSLESHISLKLSNSFINKKEESSNRELSTERNVELEIDKKIDNLLDMEERATQSREESMKTETHNLTKESDSQESLKRKSLVRGETFIIKKSNLECNDKSTEIDQGDFDSLSHSQKEFMFKKPSVTERYRTNHESSSEIYSEGEIRLPSSYSYSLGEIRRSKQEGHNMKKPSDQNCSNLSNKNKNSSIQDQNSSRSSSASKSRSLGEFYY